MTRQWKWQCIRTDMHGKLAYDIRLEKGILEPHGIQVRSVYIDDAAEFAKAAAEADAVLHSRGFFDDRLLALLRRCRIIANYGVGWDNKIDLEAATNRGILVTNSPRFCIDEVSTHTIALILAVARKILIGDRDVRAGGWYIGAVTPMRRIAGMTLGLLGFGNIAKATARKARALGFKIQAYDPYIAPEVFDAEEVRSVSFETCLKEADVLSVHLPANEQTHKMVNAGAFALMKPSAIVVNTSRGKVLDDFALADAIRQGKLAGAGLDVLSSEPPPPDHPMLSLPNVVLTGHTGFYSEESLVDQRSDAAGQVLLTLQGSLPPFLINRKVLTTNPPAWLTSGK